MPWALASSIRSRLRLTFPQLDCPAALWWEISTDTPVSLPTRIVSSTDSTSQVPSFRIWVAYKPPAAATGRHNSIISSVWLNTPGGYINPLDSPKAPSANDSFTSFCIRTSSAGLGSRFSKPITAIRTVPCPTSAATLPIVFRFSMHSKNSPVVRQFQSSLPPAKIAAVYFCSKSSVSGFTGAADNPQLPIVSVVTPCRILLCSRGVLNSTESEWQ